MFSCTWSEEYYGSGESSPECSQDLSTFIFLAHPMIRIKRYKKSESSPERSQSLPTFLVFAQALEKYLF